MAYEDAEDEISRAIYADTADAAEESLDLAVA